MKAMRPSDYLRFIRDGLAGPQREYSPEERAVALIVTDEAALRAFIDLFLCRIERRALSPRPSTDLDLAESWGRDREVRELIAWLVDLSQAPAGFKVVGDEE